MTIERKKTTIMTIETELTYAIMTIDNAFEVSILRRFKDRRGNILQLCSQMQFLVSHIYKKGFSNCSNQTHY